MKKLTISFLMLLSSVGVPVLGSMVAPAAAAAQDHVGWQRPAVVVVAPHEARPMPPRFAPVREHEHRELTRRMHDERGARRMHDERGFGRR